MTPAEEAAYGAVREIITAKEGVRLPYLAHIREICGALPSMTPEEAREAMRGLYRAGKVTLHFDVNKRPMFGLRENMTGNH